jgi:glycosyltransferase involved in cell wall biosynthesis
MTAAQPELRALVYTDQRYWRRDGGVYAQRSFVTFLGAIGEDVGRLTVLGRVSDGPGEAHYRLPEHARFLGLPWYESAADPVGLARAAAGSLRAFWRALDEADVCWLLGPSPFAIAFAALARLRRRRVVLGVRQDLPSYARSRHPGSRAHHRVADAQERAFRALARRMPVVTVGEALAEGYRRTPALLAIPVSLVREASVADLPAALARDYDESELRVLTVSRLDEEKNPLLLADVLAELLRADPRWRLLVAGEGPCLDDLRARLGELGVLDRARLLGHVDLEPGLVTLYREAHAFLHVSWTEGLPQVLFEAFAAGLPVVATDVGGVAQAAADAALLVAPGDAVAPARELGRIASDPELRERLVTRALERAHATTLEATAGRVAAFLAAPYAASSR